MNARLLANQQIRFVNAEYKKLIYYLFNDILNYFPGVPLQVEDIYNEFLFSVPDIYNKFNENKSSFKTYLVLRAKFFAKNKCRSWGTKNHKIMNYSSSLFYDIKDENNTVKIENPINISSLDNFEKMLYYCHIENNLSINDTCEKMNITKHKFRILFESIKIKLYNHNFKKISII